MSDEKFERFGKYLILDHLVDGGMAKICRARYLGEQANKIVAIKMVQPQFSKDPSFVQMFEDELKVTFGLLHPNIAQMYDYGIVDQCLYTAMEYVDGANLKQYLDRLKDKNFVFPVEISTYITSQVCQALHYAHTFTDKLTGKPFNIVHRDISPHNIMLTYDGSVKVIDFGIAKADSNSEATQAGTIKGKLSYLAPEYLDGLQLDHRYDQFAVGVTLWELLCSRKLFQATNDLAVLKLIQACKVPPPSTINPNVPKELDLIVLKALSKDRNQRFENMDKFNRALIKFLYSNYPDFNATDLGYFANQLFKEEIQKDREKFVEYGKIDIKTYLEEIANEGSSPATAKEAPSKGSLTRKIELDFNLDKEDATRLDGSPIELEVGSGTGIHHQTQLGRKTQIRPSRETQSPQRQQASSTRSRKVIAKKSSVNGTRTTTRKKLAATRTKKQTDSGPFKKIVAACLLLAAGTYFQSDLISEYTDIDISKLVGKKPYFESGEQASAVSRGYASTGIQAGAIRFSNLDSSMQIRVNGKVVESKGLEINAPLGESLSISVHKSGYRSYVFSERIYLDKSNPRISLRIPDLQREAIGLLSTSRNFTSGSKLILEVDGEIIERDLPFSDLRIPVGEYDAVISNPLLGTERRVLFHIEENKRTFLQ